MVKKTFIKFLTFLLFCGMLVFPQGNGEVYIHNDDLPAINNFKLLMQQIWENAYHNKDYSMLRSYKNQVINRSQKIISIKQVKVPKETKSGWESSIKQFKSSVNNYSKYASGKNNQALLASVEKLHAAFENVLRLMKTYPKEVDDFKSVFDIIYNKYLPAKEYGKILSLKDKLVEDALLITRLNLAEKSESDSLQILTAGQELLKSVKKFSLFNEASKAEDIEIVLEDISQRLDNLVSYF